jgi:putative redox protein
MSLSLTWQGGLKFASGPAGPPLALDSSAPNVVSPMQTLGYALMACMAMDVAHLLQKARHDLQTLTVTFEGTRAQESPRRYTAIHLHFEVGGDVPETAVERAIELSRTTYCSVWHSMRRDIQLRTSFRVSPEPQQIKQTRQT